MYGSLSLRYWIKGFVTALIEGCDGPVAFDTMLREINRNIVVATKIADEWRNYAIDEQGLILTDALRELSRKKIIRGITIRRSRMYHARVTLSDRVMRGILRKERQELALVDGLRLASLINPA